MRYPGGSVAAGVVASCDLENRRVGFAGYSQLRLPGRGAALVGGGGAVNHHQPRIRAGRCTDCGFRRANGAGETSGADGRYGGGITRSVFCHPGAVEIPAHGPGRNAGHQRHDQTSGDGGTFCGVHVARCVWRWRRPGDVPRRSRNRRFIRCAARASGPRAGGGICGKRAENQCRARRLSVNRLCRLAHLFAGIGDCAISVRQWPPGAGQAVGGGIARGVS